MGRERDLVGSYFDRVHFFQVPTLSEGFAEVLSSPEVSVLLRSTIHSAPQRWKQSNFVTVVDDSTIADIWIETGVDSYDFRETQEVENRTVDDWLWGPFKEDSPQVVIGATVRVRTHDRQRFAQMEFDIVGMSHGGVEKSEAYAEAGAKAADVFMLQLFRVMGPYGGGPEKLHWKAN